MRIAAHVARVLAALALFVVSTVPFPLKLGADFVCCMSCFAKEDSHATPAVAFGEDAFFLDHYFCFPLMSCRKMPLHTVSGIDDCWEAWDWVASWAVS